MLKDRGFEADIVEGEKSQYDVLHGGELLFSKQREGRFPDDDEILDLVSASENP